MMRRMIQAFGILLWLGAGPAAAQAPMDLDAVDPALLKDFLGDWSITNADGSRTCRVTLLREAAIGGMAINVDRECGQAFPVMDEVAAWRLHEDWQIVLVDATRKTLIRFSTPDNTYVADPEADGIATIAKIDGGLEN